MKKMNEALADYHRKLEELGVTLKRRLPKMNWQFDEESGVWRVTNCRDVLGLRRKFEYKNEWKSFLDIHDLVIWWEYDQWYGFSLS